MFGLGGTELSLVSFFLLISIIPGVVGSVLALKKGRSAIGWFFICLFVPIAVFAFIFLKIICGDRDIRLADIIFRPTCKSHVG